MGSLEDRESSRSNESKDSPDHQPPARFAWQVRDLSDQIDKRRFLKPNVTLAFKKEGAGTKRTRTNIVSSIAEAIQGAKQVDKVFIQPYIAKLESEGLDSSGKHFADHIEAAKNKFMSFERSNEPKLEHSLNLEVARLRQAAYAKSKKRSKRTLNPFEPYISGTRYSFQGEVLLSSLREDIYGTYICEKPRIKLPPARYSVRQRTTLENVYFESHMLEGPVSHRGAELDYEREFSSDEPHLIYIDELRELKHIYKFFWWGARRCSKHWLTALYDVENLYERVHSVGTAPFRPYDGEHREDTVLFEIDFEEIEVSVDKLYQWILEYRVPGKEYAIGDCEDFKLVLYSLLLTERHHRDPVAVAEGLKAGMLEEAFESIGNLLLSTHDLDHSVSNASNFSSIVRKLSSGVEVREANDGIHEQLLHVNLESIAEESKSDYESTSSENVSTRSGKSVRWWDTVNDEVVPEDDEESSDEQIAPPEPREESKNPAGSFRLRGWFEGEAIEDIPDTEDSHESQIDRDPDEDVIVPELSDEDRLNFYMVDPAKWRPMNNTTYRQLAYVWGAPRSTPYKVGVRLSKFATFRKTGIGT